MLIRALMGAVALTLLAGRAGPTQQAPAVCMRHSSVRLM
jgi:hypothetical protein